MCRDVQLVTLEVLVVVPEDGAVSLVHFTAPLLHRVTQVGAPAGEHTDDGRLGGHGKGETYYKWEEDTEAVQEEEERGNEMKR